MKNSFINLPLRCRPSGDLVRRGWPSSRECPLCIPTISRITQEKSIKESYQWPRVQVGQNMSQFRSDRCEDGVNLFQPRRRLQYSFHDVSSTQMPLNHTLVTDNGPIYDKPHHGRLCPTKNPPESQSQPMDATSIEECQHFPEDEDSSERTKHTIISC